MNGSQSTVGWTGDCSLDSKPYLSLESSEFSNNSQLDSISRSSSEKIIVQNSADENRCTNNQPVNKDVSFSQQEKFDVAEIIVNMRDDCNRVTIEDVLDKKVRVYDNIVTDDIDQLMAEIREDGLWHLPGDKKVIRSTIELFTGIIGRKQINLSPEVGRIINAINNNVLHFRGGTVLHPLRVLISYEYVACLGDKTGPHIKYPWSKTVDQSNINSPLTGYLALDEDGLRIDMWTDNGEQICLCLSKGQTVILHGSVIHSVNNDESKNLLYCRIMSATEELLENETIVKTDIGGNQLDMNYGKSNTEVRVFTVAGELP